jgi:hypothetical protein
MAFSIIPSGVVWYHRFLEMAQDRYSAVDLFGDFRNRSMSLYLRGLMVFLIVPSEEVWYHMFLVMAQDRYNVVGQC